MSKRRRRIKPVDDAKTYILSCTDKSGIMSRLVDSYKGRGVIAMQPIEPGDFVLEYRGKLLTQEECQSRQYSEIESTFLFDFEWQNRRLCLDASKEDGSLGRLVNDNHKNPNCVMKKITAAAVEKETSPVHQMSYPQTPAAAVEKETSPVYQMCYKASKPDETNAQTDSGPEGSYRLYDSDETIVKETSDEASPNIEQSDDELVPSLRRTKSIMMDRVQDFAGCLYDSSDDSTEGTFISKPERDSQRLRRSSCHPVSLFLILVCVSMTVKMSVVLSREPGTDSILFPYFVL
ncbi:uncharacterized protein LOC124849902 isoform X3 [Scophthalmus maximus]|uniref:uncharacterized protein LOC124849902 isoform X3 n=1 Tax=Scophthalmus maximus TaxID=52904 RepID=UPI001FA8FD32|nr:uncharacterized protein LOC124849902 isoform X3 [Scophthalmus maximus]